MAPKLHIMNSSFTRLMEVCIEIWTHTGSISEPEALLGDRRIQKIQVGRWLMGCVDKKGHILNLTGAGETSVVTLQNQRPRVTT